MIPVWEDQSKVPLVVGATEGNDANWLHAKFLRFSEIVSAADVLALKNGLENAEFVSVESKFLPSFDFIATSPKLSAISIFGSPLLPVLTNFAEIMEKFPEHKLRMRQFQLTFGSEELGEEFLKKLFILIGSMPLTHLDLTIDESEPWLLKLICDLLKNLAPTLCSFEVFITDLEFGDLLTQTLLEGKFLHLQRLMCYGFRCSVKFLEGLTNAMRYLPALDTIRLRIYSADCLGVLTRHFADASISHSIKRLTLDIGAVSKTDMRLFFEALKNTRAMRLHASVGIDALVESGLCETGWLTHLDRGSAKGVHFQAQRLVARNRRRHEVCFRVCIRLLCIRKHKRALTLFPFEIVRMIALNLWDSRCEDVWDSVAEASSNSKNETDEPEK